MDETRYDTLCSDLIECAEGQVQHTDDAAAFAVTFCNALAAYLGAPTDPPAVCLRGVRAQDGDVELTARVGASSSHGYVALTRDDEWAFAIQLTLPPEKNLICRCYFTLCDRTVRLRVSKQEFTLILDDPASFTDPLEALYQHYRSVLKWRPGTGEPKPTLGFDLGTNV